jgi:hypothetical protein
MRIINHGIKNFICENPYNLRHLRALRTASCFILLYDMAAYPIIFFNIILHKIYYLFFFRVYQIYHFLYIQLSLT